MPDIKVNGVRLHYVEQGLGPEAVIFSHSYLLDWSHFKPQIDALSEGYRCIAFDHRGHGASERPKEGYDMESLYARTRSLSSKPWIAPPFTSSVFRREDSLVCDSDFAGRSFFGR
jgi:pimeloyl-ACP methyl ester carboxylesterase